MRKGIWKRILVFGMAACLVIGTPVIANAASKKTVKATSVTLNKTVYTLKNKKTVKLKATIAPKKATTKTLVWSSSNKKVATVDKKGKVTAKKNGKATITVKVKNTNKKATCKIIVGTPVTKVSVTPQSVSLNEGQTFTIKTTVSPKTATTKSVSYVSNNAKVAKVDSNGIITAVSPGKANITVTAKDGTGKKAVVFVTVKALVKSISLSAEKTEVWVGDDPLQLTTKILPENAANKKVNYSSSAPEIAAVSEDGKVTGVSSGTAKIKAVSTDGSKIESEELDITVKVPLRGLKLAEESQLAVLDVNEEGKALKVIPVPETAKITEITYSSSSPEIISVSEEGLVKGLKNGKATIKVSAKDERNNIVVIEKELIVGTSVTEVQLDIESCELYEGNSKQLTAIVLPDTASKKSVTWKSSNESVATVNSAGLVKAVAEGEADITVRTDDGGFEKNCHIVVSAVQNQKSVLSQEDLDEALQNSELQVLTIGEDAKSLEIKEGKYENVSLIVNAPDGHVENHATFKDIIIKAISRNTFVEHASGNTIFYEALTGSIEIADNAVASVVVGGSEEQQLNLINNGNISNLQINNPSDISISGLSDSMIQANVAATGERTVISTSEPLNVASDAKVILNLEAGSEGTVMTVSNDDKIPEVNGLGSVQVNIQESGNLETVVGENTGTDYAQKVKVSGSVRADSGAAVGAKGYIVPYSAGMTADNVKDNLEKAVATFEVAEDGKYLTEEISIGNYYLLVQLDGYIDVVETLVLTSTSQEVYNAETIMMISGSESQTGNLKGTLYDAETGAAVGAKITVKIRSGKNNLSGDALQETETAEDGTYSFKDLPAGQYTVQILDNRNDPEGSYVSTSFHAVVEAGKDNVKNGTVTYIIASDQIRFVLTWGDEASGASKDLDSHLTGPAADGGQFHTWYGDEEYYATIDDEEVRYADLDVDDTTWEGPETTTIYKRSEGVYHFYIHDFSNRGSATSTQMGSSAAVVKVFSGNRLLDTYNVPNQGGTLWHVCDFDTTANKLIPINKMSYWRGDCSDIGIDLFERYKGQLGDLIGKVNLISSTITDKTEADEVKEMLQTAQNVYDTAEEQSALLEQLNILRNWCQTYNDNVAIEEVSGENIYSYDYDSLNYDIDVSLELEGYTKDMPEFTVTVPEGSSYEIKTDSESGDVSIVVTAPNGCYRIYHVSYQMSSVVYRIESVTGTGMENDWDVEGAYDDETDELLYRKLYVYGTEVTLPDDFSVIAKYNQAKVEIKDSDREGFEKMVIISHEDISRVYYVVYRISSIVYTIGEVSGTGMDSEGWSRWIYDDETDEVLYKEFCVFGLQEKLPEDFAVEAAYEGSTAEVKDSDREGYEKMVVVSYKNTNQVYYVSYEISSVAYEVGQVNGTGIDDWRMSWGYDEYTDEEYNVLYVYGIEENLPEDFAVEAAYEESTAEVKDSDREGYEKMVVVSYKNTNQVYYVSYEISSAAYEVGQVNGTGIDGWRMSWGYDEYTDEEYNVLYVYGTEENLPEDFAVVAAYEGSTAVVKDSDREGYEKTVVISYMGEESVYYVSYKISSAVYNIGGISGTGIGEWQTDWDYDEDTDEEYYILYVYGTEENLPEDFEVTPSYQESIAEIKDSDREGYEKMVEISCRGNSKIYYISYEQETVEG